MNETNVKIFTNDHFVAVFSESYLVREALRIMRGNIEAVGFINIVIINDGSLVYSLSTG